MALPASPRVRLDASMAYDPALGKIVMFGGKGYGPGGPGGPAMGTPGRSRRSGRATDWSPPTEACSGSPLRSSVPPGGCTSTSPSSAWPRLLAAPATGWWPETGACSGFGPGASFHGSMGGTRLNQPVVGMADDPTMTVTGWWPPMVGCSPSARPTSDPLVASI